MASQPIPTFEDFKAQLQPREDVSVKVTYPGIQEGAPVPSGDVSAVGKPDEIPTFDQFQSKEVNPGLLREFGAATVDQLIGMAKGVGSTAWGVNSLFRKYIPGLAWASNKISDYTLGHHISDEEFEHGREVLGLVPTNLAQKVGFGAEQIGEFFVPGAAISKGQKLAEAGVRFAEAFPKLAKAAPLVEYGARGVLEAAPAMAIAKAQGQEDVGSVGAFAMAGPTFGKLLNKTGASKAATGTAKGVAALVSKTIAEKIPEVQQSPRAMMWRALKPYVRNRDFDKALDNAMPEIYAQAKMAGKKIETVDDFLGLLKSTKKRIWAPYQRMLGETRATIDGNQIADAIVDAVTPRQAAKDPGALRAIQAWAEKYRAKGQMGLAEAEDWLQNVNAEIQSFYNKYPAARHATLEADPVMAASVKEAEALREAINATVDKVNIPKVKEVYGALSNLEQEAYRRVNVSKRLAPESLVEQMSKVRAAGEFAWGLVRGHPLEAAAALAKGTAYKKAAEIIKERNTSDYLIKKAFSDFGDYVEQAKRAHRIPTAVEAVAQEKKPSTSPLESAKITTAPEVKPLEVKPNAGQSQINQSTVGKGALVQEAPAASPTISGGSTTRIQIPGEARGYDAQYVVRELDDVQSSHNPHNFQPNDKYSLKNDRDYSRVENQEKVLTNSGKDFNPSYLITDNPDATNGPPVIDALGNAIGGNGRLMILGRVYKSNEKGAAAYRAALEQKAAQFGIDPTQLKGMKQPVLVRQIPDENLLGGPGKQGAITDLNKVGTASLRPVEKAIADSRRVSQGTLEHIAGKLDAAGADSTLADLLKGRDGTGVFQKLIDDGVVSPQEKAAYVSNGELTPEGKSRVSKLLLGRFFADPAQLENTTVAIQNKLERTAAALASVEGKTGWNLSPTVQKALSLLESAGKKGRTDLKLFVKQQGLFGTQEYSPEVLAMAEALQGKGINEFSKAVRQYAEDAQFASSGKGLFGNAPTPASAFEDAFGAKKK